MDGEVLNPFTPGAGAVPPLIAGRDKERRVLGGGLARVKAGRPGEFVVMHGPRGNGKTVLLSELRGQAVEQGVRVVTLVSYRSGDDASTDPWVFLEGAAPKQEITVTNQRGVPGVMSETHQIKSITPETTIRDLPALAEAGPVLLVVDEAHMLPPDFGRSVLHIVQACSIYGLPLMAVFAGTPGLPANFRAMHASFWERAKQLMIGRLESKAAVREALSVPAADSGLPFDAEALDLLMSDAQRYPFFIQMLGSASWRLAFARGGGGISVEDARAGVEEAESERIAFYENRRLELIKHKVIDDAETISEEMAELKDGESFPWKRMMELLEGGESDPDLAAERRERVQERLVSLGLIWRLPDGNWEPGIPSLCSCLAERRGIR